MTDDQRRAPDAVVVTVYEHPADNAYYLDCRGRITADKARTARAKGQRWDSTK